MTGPQIRIGLSAGGLGLAVAAIALNLPWLVWAAISVLMVSLVMRLMQRRQQKE